MGLKIPTGSIFYALTWPDFLNIVLSSRMETFKHIIIVERGFHVARTRNCCGLPSSPSSHDPKEVSGMKCLGSPELVIIYFTIIGLLSITESFRLNPMIEKIIIFLL